MPVLLNERQTSLSVLHRGIVCCHFALNRSTWKTHQGTSVSTVMRSRAQGADERAMSTNKDKKKKRKKRTALIVCKDRKEFWTTQTQFWQWVREGVVTKTADNPLTGTFKREHEELLVLLSNTVLNLAHPNHMREALLSRRVGLARK